nr:hypothetical protein GCM10020063_031950 [Dactylosporangium thailandense]
MDGPRFRFAEPDALGAGLGAFCGAGDPNAVAGLPSATTTGATATNTDALIAPPTRCSMRDSVADTPEKPATARPESDHAHPVRHSPATNPPTSVLRETGRGTRTLQPEPEAFTVIAASPEVDDLVRAPRTGAASAERGAPVADA